jgi:hypothetical protein
MSWETHVRDLVWRYRTHPLAHPLAPPVLAACAVILLVASAALWPLSGSGDTAALASRDAMRNAYDRVEPGRTSERELIQLGFDTGRYQALRLSQLGVQEYFMSATSTAFDDMDAAVRACFDDQDRCRALVFPLAPGPSGVISAQAARAERMVFLLRHGKVAYKAVQES